MKSIHCIVIVQRGTGFYILYTVVCTTILYFRSLDGQTFTETEGRALQNI